MPPALWCGVCVPSETTGDRAGRVAPYHRRFARVVCANAVHNKCTIAKALFSHSVFISCSRCVVLFFLNHASCLVYTLQGHLSLLSTLINFFIVCLGS